MGTNDHERALKMVVQEKEVFVIKEEKEMGDTRDLNLEEYGISKYAYRELLYFCRQYPEWKRELRELRAGSVLKSHHFLAAAKSKTNVTADPVGDLAVRRADLQRKCELVEEACKKVAGEEYEQLLHNITEGTDYYYLAIPMGRRQFYILRRAFFYELSKRKQLY